MSYDISQLCTVNIVQPLNVYTHNYTHLHYMVINTHSCIRSSPHTIVDVHT